MPPFLSAPSISDLTEIVGTRSQVLAALTIQRTWIRSRRSRTLIELLLRTNAARKALQVVLDKPTSGGGLGISFRANSRHPILFKVTRGLPAAACLEAYDEILSVAGHPCQSAEHAVQLIRNAPVGKLKLIKLLPPQALARSVRVLQAAYRSHADSRARQLAKDGLVRCVFEKPERSCRLGIALSPEWRMHSLLAKVDPSGLAHAKLHEGDQICSINCITCSEPVQTAKLLRESVGRIELLLKPQSCVDVDVLRSEELLFIDQAIAASTGSLTTTNEGYDASEPPGDECAVCFQLLCEPVRWPGVAGAGCHHYFCKPCMRQLAGHTDQGPACPLCRAPACGELTPRKFVVDEAAATLIQGRHPTEYAQVLTIHRELSVEWHSRSHIAAGRVR